MLLGSDHLSLLKPMPALMQEDNTLVDRERGRQGSRWRTASGSGSEKRSRSPGRKVGFVDVVIAEATAVENHDSPGRRKVAFSFASKTADGEGRGGRTSVLTTTNPDAIDNTREKQWRDMIFRRQDTFARLMTDGEESNFRIDGDEKQNTYRDRSLTTEAESALEMALMSFGRAQESHNPRVYRESSESLSAVSEDDEKSESAAGV